MIRPRCRDTAAKGPAPGRVWRARLCAACVAACADGCPDERTPPSRSHQPQYAPRVGPDSSTPSVPPQTGQTLNRATRGGHAPAPSNTIHGRGYTCPSVTQLTLYPSAAAASDSPTIS